jgi:hypothetical protein
MGMHSPGWREQNEETAREEWREEVREHLASIRSAVNDAEDAASIQADPADAIAEASRIIDAANEALYKLRNGPENPENQS